MFNFQCSIKGPTKGADPKGPPGSAPLVDTEGIDMDYLYDGSFEGFLSCVYLHYYEEKATGIYPQDRYQNKLLQPWRIVETDESRAEKVYEATRSKISDLALKRVYYLILSNGEEKENIALGYLRLGFRMGCRVDSLHSHPLVFDAERLAQKVSKEAHLLTGLVRFSVLDVDVAEGGRDLLYAKIEPDHDVLELLGEHFSDRFKGDPFLIHDARRGKALYSANGQWYIAPLNEKALPDQSEREKAYRRMWKTYFDTIAIEQRINPTCQKRMMPVRYWKNLTEMRL
ncbi:MAG: TIGR03915 family putative DNA repair protein [Candidatus Dojkabacteria bacterium]